MTTSRRSGERIPAWTIGDRLRKAREFASFDQTTLANQIDVSRATISNYEANKVGQRRIVVKQALACGVDLVWLEKGESPRPMVPTEGLSPEECAVRDLNPEPADIALSRIAA